VGKRKMGIFFFSGEKEKWGHFPFLRFFFDSFTFIFHGLFIEWLRV
jgi:hypothetical protein